MSQYIILLKEHEKVNIQRIWKSETKCVENTSNNNSIFFGITWSGGKNYKMNQCEGSASTTLPFAFSLVVAITTAKRSIYCCRHHHRHLHRHALTRVNMFCTKWGLAFSGRTVVLVYCSCCCGSNRLSFAKHTSDNNIQMKCEC